MIERYLNEYEYVAASHMTIADLSMLPSVTTARVSTFSALFSQPFKTFLIFKEFGFDLAKYPRLNEWHKKLEQLPGFDENLYGSKGNAGYLRKMIGGPIFDFT
jgi:glutathione S-transferase